MSKLINYTILSVLQLSLLGCNNEIVLHKSESDVPVIIQMNKRILKVNGIFFPFILTIENNSLTKKEFRNIIFEYGYRARGLEFYYIMMMRKFQIMI